MLGALRFLLAAFPAVLVVKRPRMPLRWLFAYGATISLGQFAFLFTAMYVGMPAGLASLVLQAQAFFTVGFAALFLRERFFAHNIVGLLIAAGGLAERNELLMQIYADVTGRPIRIARSSQACAVGAAILGAVAAGSAGGGYDDLSLAVSRMGGVKDRAYAPDPAAHH